MVHTSIKLGIVHSVPFMPICRTLFIIMHPYYNICKTKRRYHFKLTLAALNEMIYCCLGGRLKAKQLLQSKLWYCHFSSKICCKAENPLVFFTSFWKDECRHYNLNISTKQLPTDFTEVLLKVYQCAKKLWLLG